MKSTLVHGCYDADTLRTLKENGIQQFGFDLRGRSPNLVPFHHLKEFLKDFSGSKVNLIFENDKPSTIASFLNMLAGNGCSYQLEFRDQQTAEAYDAYELPYFWMFSPAADWKKILSSRNIRGVLLPLEHKSFYQKNQQFWQLIEMRSLEAYIHAVNFSEALKLEKNSGALISVDLSREMEKGFRVIDQDKLRKEIAEIL